MTRVGIVERETIERIFKDVALEAQQRLTYTLQRPKKKVIILAGPTAVGKSELGMSLARSLGGEIISADSMQVYCGMDIGTAKPSKEDRLSINHHLVDVRQINEPYNVVDFYYEARHTCQLIHTRDNTSIVVGGSGFYLHSLIYGPPTGPPSMPEVRQHLEDQFELDGGQALYYRLTELDPAYASTITSQDKQKIIRALEIITLTGKPVSSLPWKTKRNPQNYDFRCWFLTRPREELYHRIEKRCAKMLDEGFLDEVKNLDSMGLRENSSAAQAIGYRQALEYLDSPQTAADYAKFVAHFKQASRNYAKRQITWFRREPLFRWLDLNIHDPEVAIDIITKDFEML
jgi:tRNA dimethylallyltransferase